MAANWVDYLLMILVLVIVAVDAYLAHTAEKETISWRISKWSEKWPVIAFMIGFLCGHLFFPNHAFCP
jgi:uncharacterized membrane protein